MSGNNSERSTSTAQAPTGNPYVDLWSDYLKQSGNQSRALLEGLQAMGDPQKLQRHMFETLAESFDRFMRSPAFLETMRQNLKVMTDLKKFQDQAIEDAARHVGVPLASDVHGLFERLNSIEQIILNRLQSLESRLDGLESKLRGGSSG